MLEIDQEWFDMLSNIQSLTDAYFVDTNQMQDAAAKIASLAAAQLNEMNSIRTAITDRLLQDITVKGPRNPPMDESNYTGHCRGCGTEVPLIAVGRKGYCAKCTNATNRIATFKSQLTTGSQISYKRLKVFVDDVGMLTSTGNAAPSSIGSCVQDRGAHATATALLQLEEHRARMEKVAQCTEKLNDLLCGRVESMIVSPGLGPKQYM